jgi:branched-chain amino acid transport system substrate-binding protein
MKKKLTGGILILLVIALTFILPMSSCGGSKSPKELKIGGVFELTGPGSSSLKYNSDGVEAAAIWVNQNGGITVNGEKYLINYIPEDNKMSPEGAVAATEKLVYDDQVKFIIGPIMPFLASAMKPITEPNKVLHFKAFFLGNKDEMGPDIPYTFAPQPKIAGWPYAFDYLQEAYPEVQRVFILAPNDPMFTAGIEAATNEATSRGYTVVGTELYGFDVTDFYTIWTKVMNNEADALTMAGGVAAGYGLILKQGRELGFNGPIFSGQGTGDMETIVATAGPAATDLFVGDFFVGAPGMSPITDTAKDIVSENWGGQRILVDHVFGWNCLWALTQAIEEAQSLDPTEVMNTFEKMESIESLTGTGTMGGQESYGINHVVTRPEGLTKVQDGEIELIRWFLPEIP